MSTILILYPRPGIIRVAVIKSFWWTDHDANIHPSVDVVCPFLPLNRSFGFCQETGVGSKYIRPSHPI